MFDRIHEIVSVETSDLKKLAKAAGADYRMFYVDADLSGVDLRGQDLSEFDLSETDLSDALIDGATRLPSNVGASRSPKWKDEPGDAKQSVILLYISSSHRGMTDVELEKLKTLKLQDILRLIMIGRKSMEGLIDTYLLDFYQRRRISASIRLSSADLAFQHAEADRFSRSSALGFVPSKRIYLSALLNVGIEQQGRRPFKLDADLLDR